MLSLGSTFTFRSRDRLIVTFGPVLFAFMFAVTYFTRSPNDSRLFYLWFFGVLSLVYIFAAWYYDQFRYHITSEGIWWTPALQSRTVYWHEIIAAELFEQAIIICVLENKKRVIIPLAALDNPQEILETLKRYIPAQRFRPAPPPSMVNLIRYAPAYLIFGLVGGLLGIAFGDYLPVLIGLGIGILGSIYLMLTWRKEHRTGVRNKSAQAILWLLLFIPSFMLLKKTPGASVPSFRVIMAFTASSLFILCITAVISYRYLPVSAENPSSTES